MPSIWVTCTPFWKILKSFASPVDGVFGLRVPPSEFGELGGESLIAIDCGVDANGTGTDGVAAAGVG